MFNMTDETGQVETNAANVIPESQIATHRLLKIFDQQTGRIHDRRLFETAQMTKKTFLAQVKELRLKLEQGEFLASGNMHLVTCLPPAGSLAHKMGRLRKRRHGSRCSCNLGEMVKNRSPRKLHALVGVSDGCTLRLPENGARDTRPASIWRMVSPHEPMSVWSILDMTFLYPDLLGQQGFVCGRTLIRDVPTVIWEQNGILTFGSIDGKSFRSSKKTRWGVPSFKTLVTI